MKNEKLARHGIMNMTAYIPGKPVEEVQREYGLTDVIKLASNENPLHTSPKAVEAMRIEAEKVYMYPEGTSPALREALGKRLGVDKDCILVGNGGDHVINMICEAFVGEGEQVIVGDPSFKTYESSCDIMGGELVRVPLKNRTYDLAAIANAITEKTKLIFVCNPNNPTGTIVTKAEVEAFLDKVPESCIVAMDEAYFEFVDDPDYPNGVDFVKQGKNVIVIRTFSKIYGLAGMRIGYAVTTPDLMEPLMRVMPPFPVNRVAQAGALAALTDTEFYNETRRVNAEGRDYLRSAFAELHMDACAANGNYVFVDTKLPAKELAVEMLKRGIIVRPAGQWGYPTSIRVTVGTMEENKRFIEVLAELQKIL